MRLASAFLCLALFVAAPSAFPAAAWELFESQNPPAGWSASGTGSQIRTVATRSLQGTRALEWSWTQPATSVTWNISPATSGSGNLVFSQWVRLENPIPGGQLRVELRSTDGGVRAFHMNLDFTGWRTVFVPYSSMSGNANNNVNRVTWSLVGIRPLSGTIYLDQIILGHPMDDRFQYADLQVPFVWQNEPKSMWESRVHWHHARPDPVAPTAAENSAVQNLLQTWDAMLIGSGSVTSATVDGWQNELNRYNVRRENGIVRGNQIYYRQYPGNAYPSALASLISGKEGPNAFQDFTILMLNLARGWHRTTDPQLRARIASMIVLMSEHLLDQGWASGSNQGSLFLLGYQSREYMRAVYLARHIFADAGMLDEMAEAARWYSQTGSLLDDRTAPNMDFFNTMMQGMLLSILMEPDNQIRVAWLRAFSEKMSDRIVDKGVGDVNGFKPDGTAFHHSGHYPAYASGAIRVLGEVFETFHDTPFELRDDARMRFRDVLLALRLHSQKLDWPIGISGRHPFSGNYGIAQNAFAALAKYPDPQRETAPDREIASAYSRIWGTPSGTLGTLFRNANIRAETLAGFSTFPFANLAVYRGDNWMVSMKGYSKYVWSSEIYAADNRFGRYQSNGSAEILLETGRAASGFQENGWDWNRLPGTTSVHLPLNELESPTTSQMLRSTEVLAGGLTTGPEGAFGFILNESRFGHTLRARKSYFAADGILVALGSEIESTHTTAPAETTLFQVALNNTRPPITVSTSPNAPISTFPWETNLQPGSPIWLIDPVGNGFWIPSGQKIHLSRVRQTSRHNKTESTTAGDFAAAWLQHGTGINNATYQYAIIPQTSVSEMSNFQTRMAGPAPAYEILRQDPQLHAIHFPDPNRYGFTIFEPGAWENLPHLLEADRQSLLWIESEGDNLTVSAANPDLNPGTSENLVTPTGFLLGGLWSPADPEQTGVLTWHENHDTRIVFPAKEGATITVVLKPVNQPDLWQQDLPGSDPETVANFRLLAPGAPLLAWNAADESIRGYIVERAFPATGPFQPIALLDAKESEFWDPNLPANALAYYRVRPWTASGAGAASRSLLVHSQSEGIQTYDFLKMNSTDELRARGWTSSGIFSAQDWFFTAQGMFMIDTSPSHTANLVIPISANESGRISARMGTANTSLYRAKFELLAGDRSLGMIELYSQTAGTLFGASDVPFTDLNWDVTRGGTTRDISIEWRPIPETNRLEITLRYNGTTEEASAVNRWEIANSPTIRPDRIRLTSGTNSNVNRGLVLQKLLIIPGQETSLDAAYRAWAEEFLGNPDAAPAADTNGDGISNLIQFLWSRDIADPTAPIRPQTRAEPTADSVQFSWDVPDFPGVQYRVESAENLGSSWQTVPHSQNPLPSLPGWLQLKTAPSIAPRSFYRLIIAADLDT